MELLFTDATGTEELKEHLGFLDISLKYANIKGKIKTATNDVIKLIGKETYDLAVVEYKKADSDETKNEDFIFNVRNPIAIQAYRKFAPHNDLSHTTSGRLNRLEEGQKSAFEWMIDKDDKALERSYYESLDDLINYLDEEIESWKETDQYKKTHQLFITSAADFDDVFPIGTSRLLFLKLAPGIRKAENNEIKTRVGKELFETLKADSSTNEELSLKIKEASAYYAMAWALRRLSVQLFPEGILQGFTSERMTINAKKPAENNEAYSCAAYLEIDANQAFLDIEAIISELNKDVDAVIEPITFNPSAEQPFINL